MSKRLEPDVTAFARGLRSGMTDAEHAVWHRLRERQLRGLKFRRQHPLFGYVVDFVCLEAKLIVEIDGGQHSERVAYDEARTALLEGHGYLVLRFWNSEVLTDISAVMAVIEEKLKMRRA